MTKTFTEVIFHERLKFIEQEIDRLHKQIEAYKLERFNILAERIGVKIGEIVWSRRYKKNMKVVRFSNPEYRWIVASPKNTDGSWSKREHMLFDDWEAAHE